MAKRKQSKNRKQIKRQTRHFQLRVEHPQDQHVREILDYAKSQRREVTVIRDAVSLFWALEQGNLEALFERFPQYKAQFTSGGGAGGGDDTSKQIAAMLEIFMAEQKQKQAYVMQSALPATTPLKVTDTAAAPVTVVTKAEPVSDDAIIDNMFACIAMFD